eukprot:CAMPEP_0114657172 /NCGR_PEP_ID=MMETSP0191-20121206/13459_1 /TAXON_ID=126664 /ORGANISM="Sorites sp." /LENGTH=203 /DNA_ID=CAMNT_0001875883 /DNA_START=105 /DNA_END=716 /DNA_ORIENTATION=+
MSTSIINQENVSPLNDEQKSDSLETKGLKRKLDTTATDNETPNKRIKLTHDKPVLQIKLLSDDARIPTKGSILAAGYDLYSAEDKVIKANDKGLVKTDLSIGLPVGCYGRIAPRSGLAYKNFIDIGAGVIDGDYRGPVGVVMFNHDKQDFKVTKGMRVAQLILERYVHDAEIKCVDELTDTLRGDGGFGSTGLTDDNKDSKQN